MARRRGAKPGKTLGLGPPEGQQWFWMTSAMLGSPTFRALGISARRVLDFLIYEHVSHGGRENGNLGASYRQLGDWGVTPDDIRKGLEELYAAGFVRLTRQGMRQGGKAEPSRYALTWLPCRVGTPEETGPTHEWRAVLDRLYREGRMNVTGARAFLKEALRASGCNQAVRRKQATTPHLRVVPPLTCGAGQG